MNRLLLLAAFAWPALAAAQTPAPVTPAAKPDAAKIVNEVCAACHGADGNSAINVNPSLAGQGADYITLQLRHFKAGIRQNAIMQGFASTLSDADMAALGEYFARQKPKALTARDPALVKTGQRLYRGGVAAAGIPACSACHSPNGSGVPKNYPRLSGQHADYSYAQLKAFGAGSRGNDKDGKDTNGRIMHAVAGKMSDEQMKAVADYMQGLR
jgi:cytochrome c553